MKRILVPGAFVLACVAAAAVAGHGSYAGQQDREIKALSPGELEGLRKGEGMGMAKAAELNHYPGPRHVLDLAEELGLTPKQKKATEALYRKMHRRAVRLGRSLIAKERELDRGFAAGTMDEAKMNRLLEEIGALRARLRGAHLAAHLAQRKILTPHQVKIYDRLRGYGAAAGGKGGPGGMSGCPHGMGSGTKGGEGS